MDWESVDCSEEWAAAAKVLLWRCRGSFFFSAEGRCVRKGGERVFLMSLKRTPGQPGAKDGERRCPLLRARGGGKSGSFSSENCSFNR